MSKPLGWFAAFLAMLALGLGIDAVYDASKAPESNVQALSALTPVSPKGMPACTTEDGAGMALCWWDAQAQGNGMGTSLVSGDCALVYGEVRDACIALHKVPAYDAMNEDGSMRSEPSGAMLVQECNDIENNATNDPDAREVLESEGWNLFECYKAMLG